MELFFFWLIFAIVVGAVASARGRSGPGWFLLSMIISPLLGVILVALLPSRRGEPTYDTHVKCEMCAELVLREARKCKHCGHVFTQTAGEAERAGRENRVAGAEAAHEYRGEAGYGAGRRIAEAIKPKP
jgi:hypothetical protein